MNENMKEGLDELYREVVMDHHKYPRNFGTLTKPHGHLEGFNPLCGDRVVIDIELTDDRQSIKDIKFTGQGCSICMASASMMTEEVENAKVSEALSSVQHFRDLLQGAPGVKPFDSDVSALEGVKKFPVRIKCALLPWTTLKEVIEQCSTNS